MSTAEPLRLSIDVDRGASPVRGCVAAEGGSARAFAGWTELFAALLAAIDADQTEEESDAQNP